MTSAPWQWHPHPETWLLVAALLIGYMGAVVTLGPKRAARGERVATTGQKASFMLGLLVLLIAEEWPLHDLADGYLFSAHMVQHMLFAYVAPPLLLLVLPSWLVRSLLGRGTVRLRLVRFLTRPVVALVFFNALIVAMHWPLIVELQTGSTIFHLSFHAILLGSALITWAVVFPPIPEAARLTQPTKMFYVFLQSIIPTIPASFLTFATEPFYEVYESAPRVWDIDPGTDQMVAGLIMKLGGGLILWSIITVMFFRWNAEEESEERRELSWDDFERELEVWNLRK